ncbi:MAG: hypothetical protein Q4C96_04085 [Planctomycetia bacterium]|nr:hypothetical protein [Planctomycetia bacterium]
MSINFCENDSSHDYRVISKKGECSCFPEGISQLRILFISSMTETSLTQAIYEESHKCIKVHHVHGCDEAMCVLRVQNFDAILIFHASPHRNALEIMTALRTGGIHTPVLVLGTVPASEMFIPCSEAGAGDYLCVTVTTVQDLIWRMARVVQYHLWRQENMRWKQENSLRVCCEREEVEKSISQQRQILQQISAEDGTLTGQALPQNFVTHYQQLLKTYILMGTGNLTVELQNFGNLLAESGVSANQVLELHLQVLTGIIHHLGTKSCRHIMQRADLLRLEILIHLSNSYQKMNK